MKLRHCLLIKGPVHSTALWFITRHSESVGGTICCLPLGRDCHYVSLGLAREIQRARSYMNLDPVKKILAINSPA